MADTLRIASWNLDGLDPHRLDERTEAACFHLLLREEPPDIVLLQEVVDRSWVAHLRPHFGHAGYRAVRQPTASEYGVAMFVRQPLELTQAVSVPLPSAMGRGLLEATAAWGDRVLLVGTGHLESMREGRANRVQQLAVIAARLLAHDGPALFAGDTNLRDAEVAEVSDVARLQDAWQVSGAPRAHRHTWPTPGYGGRKHRFDRMFCNDLLEVVGFATDVGGDPPPSDHALIEVAVRAGAGGDAKPA